MSEVTEVKNVFYRRFYRIVAPIIRFIFPLEVHGREHLTEEAVVLCPNHTNAMDPILLACAMPGTTLLRVMAKKQLMGVPVIGWLIGKLGGFGVDRGNSDIGAIKTAIRALKAQAYRQGTHRHRVILVQHCSECVHDRCERAYRPQVQQARGSRAAYRSPFSFHSSYR